MSLIFSLVLWGLSSRAEPSAMPSSQSCQYYQTLENSLQCGPDSYLIKSGYPLCEHYKRISPWMTDEIQKWFPKIRYCLQAALEERENEITCANLDQTALETHVDCYVQTGYCDLSLASKTQLSLVTLPRMTDSLWRKTAREILKACDRKN